MKTMRLLPAGVFLLGWVMSAPALGSTAGGATIHSAATLSFDGGEVTASVNVLVETIASAPVFTVDTVDDVFAGDAVAVDYTLVSTSNGVDTYDLVITSDDQDVSGPDNLTISPTPVTLGASITSADSEAGTLFIPAGSESDLDPGDRIVMEVAGASQVYEITAVNPGTPASTTGSTTTAEEPTSLELEPVDGATPIDAGTVPAGTQLGERVANQVTFDAGTPDTAGQNGLHVLEVSGTTTALDTGGAQVAFTDGLQAEVTVLSGDATLTREVRNVTQGEAFATSGVTAQSGDELEYRIRMEASEGETVTGAALTDTVAQYTAYQAGSTTLNGDPVADTGTGDGFPLADPGLEVNSPGEADGVLVDSDAAEVLYRVIVD